MNEDQSLQLGWNFIPSKSLFVKKPPPSLFHYTDCNGLSGILESNSLWLTKLSYLNDKSELQLAIDMLAQELIDESKATQDSIKSDFLQRTAVQIEGFRSTNIGVASFCEDGDLLSQWRSYGNNGSGVALEFNATYLRNLRKLGTLNLWKCVYSPSDHKTILKELVENLKNTYDILECSSTDSFNRTKKDLIGWFNTSFLQVAPIIKDRHFSEEKEWRIITTSIPITDSNWHARVSNNRVSQYYQLNFSNINNGERNFIEGFVVGPSERQNIVMDSIGVLFEKNGFKIRGCSGSRIPYRNA